MIYHRFLFAKPASVTAYCAQAFAVAGAGLLGIATVPLAALAVAGLEFTLLGGTVLLLSTLWRSDYVLAVTGYGVLRFLAGLVVLDRRTATR